VKAISCTLLGVIFFLFSAEAQVRDHFEREIGKIIAFDAEIDFERTPGLVVGLVWKDSSFLFPYGAASPEDSSAISGDLGFELGELTQVFTAALVIKLAGKGLLDLDATVSEMLGLDAIDGNAGKISLRQCLNHTSGLPRFPPDFGELEHSTEDPYASYTKGHLLEFFKDFEMPSPPPQPYAFSNLNYALLEMALEKTMGKPFSEIINEELLLPLALEQTGMETDSFLFVQGYGQNGKPAPLWSPASHQAAFGLKSTPQDLLRWMHFLLHPGPEWAAVFSELYARPAPTGIRKNTLAGYGWHIFYPKKKVRVLVHTGSTGGYMAYMAIVPETKTGVFVLANSPYGVRGLGLLVLGMLNNGWKR
jgi:CubicO group peptidase (beta-lactamase class C family)